MAGRLGGYIVRGPALPGDTAKAGGMDAVVSLILTMLAWPFPVARATLPLGVHAAGIVGTLLLVDVAYHALAAKIWGRTLGMYYYDLGLSGPERPFSFAASLAWAVGWTAALLPALLGARGLVHPDTGLPARLSHLITAAAE